MLYVNCKQVLPVGHRKESWGREGEGGLNREERRGKEGVEGGSNWSTSLDITFAFLIRE